MDKVRETTDTELTSGLNALGEVILDINTANGWDVCKPSDWLDSGPYKIPAMLALVDSESSEALEGFRNDDFENFGEEMADVIIRALDLACGLGINIEKAIADKLAKNRKRKHKHGGKRL